MQIARMDLLHCLDDKELIAAVSEITALLVDKIYIAEDMNDAIRDGFDGGIHKELSDGRIVWVSNE
jgi:hypothetical protein